MNPTRKLSESARFFWTYAGYSHSMCESPAVGRTRGAIELAAAEDLLLEAIRVADIRVEWDDDSDGAADCRADREKFETCEGCTIYRDGAPIAGLYCITDADSNYRRVVRAELAQECADELRAAIAAATI